MKHLLKKQTVDFKALEPNIQTGDIILMHGLYASSHVVEFIEGSVWSHAAMAIRAEDFGIKSDESLLLWESNEATKGVIDVRYQIPKAGPQLVSLHDRMRINYELKDDSMFAVRHLHTEISAEMKVKFKKEVIDKYNDQYKFPPTWEEMLDPIRGRSKNKKRIDEFNIFCSELVALSYMNLGLLSTLHVENSYAPVDFAELNQVGLLKRAWLGNEIIIDPKSL